METVDLNRLGFRRHVNEVHEVVGVWEFYIEGLEEMLKVKVLRFPRDDVPYMGVANLEIKNSQQADFYISLHLFATVEDALDDALRGFLGYYDINDTGLQTRPYPNW